MHECILMFDIFFKTYCQKKYNSLESAPWKNQSRLSPQSNEEKMLGFKFIKSDPNTYLIQFKNGKIVREGAGLSFYYFEPKSSIIRVPVGSQEFSFIFNEVTQDFQEVTIQGQITTKVKDIHRLISSLNYTINPNGNYVSDDPEKLADRIINLIQVCMRKELSDLTLKNALIGSESISNNIQNALMHNSSIDILGIDVIHVSILAIKPNKETSRALEAETRETILKKADEAIYYRRNAAIEQERIIKENELNTEIAVEKKKFEITEKKLAAKKIEKQKIQEIKSEELLADIQFEKQKADLIHLTTQNNNQESESRAYAIKVLLDAISKTDPKVLETLYSSSMNPAQLIASSFKALAENSEKISQLNISPDLLNQLMNHQNA